jgi:hypothetical protein
MSLSSNFAAWEEGKATKLVLVLRSKQQFLHSFFCWKAQVGQQAYQATKKWILQSCRVAIHLAGWSSGCRLAYCNLKVARWDSDYSWNYCSTEPSDIFLWKSNREVTFHIWISPVQLNDTAQWMHLNFSPPVFTSKFRAANSYHRRFLISSQAQSFALIWRLFYQWDECFQNTSLLVQNSLKLKVAPQGCCVFVLSLNSCCEGRRNLNLLLQTRF